MTDRRRSGPPGVTRPAVARVHVAPSPRAPRHRILTTRRPRDPTAAPHGRVSHRHRVVIVGGGFAGLYAARSLGSDPEVARHPLDRRNFHLFQPMLYQVATGALSPGEIAQPLRSILRAQRNATVILGEAVGIDVEKREVLLSDGGPDRVRHADRRDRRPSHATSATTSGRRTRRASRPSRTRPRSGGASSSRSRPRNGKPIRTGGASG